MWIDNRLGQYPQHGTANGSLTSVSQVGDVGVPKKVKRRGEIWTSEDQRRSMPRTKAAES